MWLEILFNINTLVPLFKPTKTLTQIWNHCINHSDSTAPHKQNANASIDDGYPTNIVGVLWNMHPVYYKLMSYPALVQPNVFSRNPWPFQNEANQLQSYVITFISQDLYILTIYIYHIDNIYEIL